MSAAGIFPDWQPVEEAVSFESATAHLAPLSPPVALPGGGAPSPLRLFGAAAVPVAAKAAGQPLAQPVSDAACFVGGAVWALDWCPRAAGGREDFLALGTHAAGAPPQPMGRPASGPGALQLWRVPRPAAAGAARTPAAKKPRGRPPKASRSEAAAAAAGASGAADDDDAMDEDEPLGEGAASCDASLPSLALLLTHDGATAWDVKWRPAPPAGAAASKSLGLLAAALGDGDVAVVAVPRPSGAGAPRALRLRPAWRGRAGPAAARGGGLPWTLDWHPAAPHNRLLAGATDGRVMYFDLAGCADAGQAPNDSDNAAAPLLQLLPASGPPLAVRSVCWAPAALGPACAPLLCAAGDDGVFTVWDARSPEAHLWRGRGASSLLLAAAWAPQPRVFVAATDSGRIVITSGVLGRVPTDVRDATLRPGGQSQLRGSPTGAAVWGIHVIDDLVAHCGADGELVVAELRLPRSGRVTATRVILASITADAPRADAPPGAPPPVLRLRGARPTEVQAAGDTEAALNDVALDALSLPRQQALHRCRWAPGDDRPRGLAAAGAAGVLRVLYVVL